LRSSTECACGCRCIPKGVQFAGESNPRSFLGKSLLVYMDKLIIPHLFSYQACSGSSHCAEDTVPTSVLVLVTHIPITLGDRSPLPDMCFLVDDLAISAPLQDSRGGSSVRGTVSDSSGKLWCWCHLSGCLFVAYLGFKVAIGLRSAT
jgi:hypothetical protein